MEEITNMESQTEQNGLSRAERKALEKAKLVQKETQRNNFKLVSNLYISIFIYLPRKHVILFEIVFVVNRHNGSNISP